jgi:hypothetical protein
VVRLQAILAQVLRHEASKWPWFLRKIGPAAVDLLARHECVIATSAQIVNIFGCDLSFYLSESDEQSQRAN